MDLHIIKIQKWFRRLPGCRKCGSKRLAWKYVCVYCYHAKHSEHCIACKQGEIHNW